jgi:hypothetical protein
MLEVGLGEEMDLYHKEVSETQEEHPFLIVGKLSVLCLPGPAADWLGELPPTMVGFYLNEKQRYVDVRGFAGMHQQYHVNNPELFPVDTSVDDFGYYTICIPRRLARILVTNRHQEQARHVLSWEPIRHQARDFSPDPVHNRVRIWPGRR